MAPLLVASSASPSASPDITGSCPTTSRVDGSLAAYQPELRACLFPFFVHCYLELVEASNLEEAFEGFFNFIDNALNGGGRVVVHFDETAPVPASETAIAAHTVR